MNKIRVLNSAVIAEHFNMADAIEAVEKAYVLHAQKQVSLFDTVFYEFEPGAADMDIKSGTVDKEGIFGMKLMSWFLKNEEKELNSLMGNIMLYSRETGAPIALLDGASITGLRTGAAGGLGAKYLAREGAEELLLIGTGNQAPYQLASALIQLKTIRRVTVCNALNFDWARSFVDTIKNRLEKDFLSALDQDTPAYEALKEKLAIDIVAEEDIEKAVRRADVILTATPSKEAMIRKEWVKKGAHLSCMGADMEGKQEIDEQLFCAAKVFTDDIEKTSRVGEMETAIKKGLFSKEQIAGELGAVILGEIPGRESDEEITIFDASGLAVQDLMAAKVLFEKAEKRDLGVVIEL